MGKRGNLVFLNVYGIGVQIESELPSWNEEIAHDFAYFVRKDLPPSVRKKSFRLSLKTTKARPPFFFRTLHVGKTEFCLNVLGESRYRLFGRAWVRYHYRRRYGHIYCDDLKVGYEVCYLLLLSYLGERLDRRGLHRIHGLGIEQDRVGALVMAPSGTGKSTLALALLQKRASRMAILSDDTPLVKTNGMLAFPQRIALREFPEIASKYVRKFSRVEYGEKFVIGSEFFRHRVRSECKLKWLFITSRPGQHRTKICEVSRWRAAWPLMKWLVVGYETPQIWEFYLRPDPLDLLLKAGIAGKRIRTASRLLLGCRTATFELSSDPKESLAHLESFMAKR